MSRKKVINLKRTVTFLADHTIIHPATVLESFGLTDGIRYTIAELPETRTEYKAGQIVEFGSVQAAKDFRKAVGEVCMWNVGNLG